MALVLMMTLASALATTAQTATVPTGELGSIDVPGPAWVLQQLGVPDGVERGSVPRILFERRFDPDSAKRLQESALLEVLAHLDLVAKAQASARQLGAEGLSLSQARTRQGRGLLENALKDLGAELKERRDQYSAALDDGRRARETREALLVLGLDATAVVARLNLAETVPIVVPTAVLPFPYAPKFWSDVVFERPVAPYALFAEVLRDPAAFQLWIGSLALDPETRQFFETSPELVRSIQHQSPGIFAAFSGSFAVKQHRVVIADEAEMRTLWEDVVDEPLSDPGRFLKRLYAKDDGRLAVFFDLVQRLPTPSRRFSEGLWMTNLEERRDRFREFYQVVSGVDPAWKPTLAPIQRFVDDPWLLLSSLRFAEPAVGNGLVGPQQRRFWERAFEDGVPDDPARSLKDIDADELVDAAWLLDKVSREPVDKADRHRRFSQVLAVQRIASGWSNADRPHALMAARGVAEFPALLLSLEQNGLLLPAVASGAVRKALELRNIGDADRRTIGIATFQGAVALVNRLVRAGSLDVPGGTALMSSLVEIPLREGRYGDRAATWLVETVLPLLKTRPTTDAGLIEQMSVQAGSKNTISWEGGTYSVDWTRFERERLAAVRNQQSGLRLEDVVRLVSVAKALRTAPFTQERARELAGRVSALQQGLAAISPMQEVKEPLKTAEIIEDAAKELAKVKSAKDAKRFERAGSSVALVAEWSVPHLLMSLAYTPHLGDPTSTAARASDLAVRHEFEAATAHLLRKVQDLRPWTPPTQSEGTVKGALLGLDLAMARLSLRRLTSSVAPRPVTFTLANLETLAMQVSLGNPRATTGPVLEEIAVGLRRGRKALLDVQGNRVGLDQAAAAAKVDAARRSVLPWMIEHEPDRITAMFSLGELLALGGEPTSPPNAVGTASVDVDGSWSLGWPMPDGWQPYSGRPQIGLLAARTPDLSIRIAELMVDAHLPAEIFLGVLSFAMQDLIDRAVISSSDDWMGLVRHAQVLPVERFEDYVSALVGLGVLVPARERH